MTTVAPPDTSAYTTGELASCLVTPTARVYGSEGWEFESLRAHSQKRVRFAGVLASLAELELELGRERRSASRDAPRAREQSIGRPKALDQSKVALAQRMYASDESASTIAATLSVSRATLYRVLAAHSDGTGE
jgi:DNA invertase Pin-like site-specific DNA recombinase